MSFSIDNLLKQSGENATVKSSESSSSSLSSSSNVQQQPQLSWGWSTSNTPGVVQANNAIVSGFVDSESPGISGQVAAVPVTQLPTLADLQLLFGGGGPKAHYSRSRRNGAERKPRQAYSSKQLEKLEEEFRNDKYLSVNKRIELSKTLKLTEVQIKTWFQNRRTKWKKQMTATLRHLYRQGLYSQYANAAACFLPATTPSSNFNAVLAGLLGSASASGFPAQFLTTGQQQQPQQDLTSIAGLLAQQDASKSILSNVDSETSSQSDLSSSSPSNV